MSSFTDYYWLALFTLLACTDTVTVCLIDGAN